MPVSQTPSNTVSATPSPPQTDWVNPSSLVLTVGAISAGALSDLYKESTSGELILTETIGTPGFTYDFTFGEYEDVPSTNVELNVEGWYEGNVGHVVKLQQWNYITNGGQWENVTANTKDFPDVASEQTYNFHLIEGANYTAFGNIKLRLNHSSPGNINHFMHLDKFYLGAGGASMTPSRTESFTPSQTVSFTPSNTPSPSHTVSFTPSNTPSPSHTVSFTPSGTPSPSHTVSITQSRTPSQTLSFTPSNTPSPSYTPSATPSATPSYGPPMMIDKLDNSARFKYIRVGEGLVLEADRDTIYISLS